MTTICLRQIQVVGVLLVGLSLVAIGVSAQESPTSGKPSADPFGEESPQSTKTPRSSPAASDDAMSVTFHVRKSGEDHIRMIYHANAIPVADLEATVKQLFSAEGKLPTASAPNATKSVPVAIASSPISNSLVVSGPPAAVNEIAELLRELDQHMGQVVLEVEFGEVPFTTATSSPTVPPTEEIIRWAERPADMVVLGRAQLTTLHNNPAFVQMGNRVPMVIGTTKTASTESQNTQLRNVGLLVGFTPRITLDGQIVMEIDVERSFVGPESDGVPISVSDENVVRAPLISVSSLQTTVTVTDGQTIVLGSVAEQAKATKSLVVVMTSRIVRPGEQAALPASTKKP